MSAMRWFRKHNKKIMVIAGCILMVAFLLPAAFFRASGKNPAEQDVAYFNDTDGKQIKITQGMLDTAENELKALQMLGISEFQFIQLLQKGSLPRFPGLVGVGVSPVLATHLLLFSSQSTNPRSTSLNQQCRDFFTTKANFSDWAEDEETLNFLKESIQRLTGVEAQDAAYYYLLLAYEARQMGIQPAADSVNKLLELRHVQKIKIADIIKRCNLRETGQLKKAVANYVAIVRYCDLVTKTLVISEPQLKKTIRDDLQQKNVSGNYVTFHGYNFRNQVGEPKLEELQEQLDQYKASEPKKGSEENPHGFGYLLPDRVKIEFLIIDLAQVRKGIESLHAQKNILERKKLEQTYWEQDKTWFVNQYKSAKEKPGEESGESKTEDTKDERYARLEWEREKVWQKRQAYQTATNLLNKAKTLSQSVLSISALKQLASDQRAQHAADYADIAIKLNQSDPNEPEILYNPDYDGSYVSEQELFRLQGLSGAYLLRPQQQPLPISNILFQCKPFYKGIVTRLDETPVELYEDIGPLIADRAGPNGAVYLVRITGVDPSRPPVSIYDDGKLGSPPDSFDPNENNSLYQLVKQDWQKRKQFSLAVEEANRFVTLADPNWAGALAKVNEEHQRDPNLPGPLRQTSLTNDQKQIENLNRTIKENPQAQMAQWYQARLDDLNQLLKKSMELAQQRTEQNEQDRAVLEREDNMSCLVFKDLKLSPPSQQEYLRRKPLNTRLTIESEQEMLTLMHLAPTSIKKRTGFQRKFEKDE